MKLREKHLSPFRYIHPNLLSGGISLLVPLQAGQFVIVSHPGPVSQPASTILLAQGEQVALFAGHSFILTFHSAVITIYTKSGAKAANHDWAESVQSVGEILYISLRIFAPVGGAMFSSIACRELDCATYMHLPAKQVLSSLATYPINRQQLPLSGPSSSLVTLCPDSWSLFKSCCSVAAEVATAVHALGLDVKKSTQAARAE